MTAATADIAGLLRHRVGIASTIVNSSFTAGLTSVAANHNSSSIQQRQDCFDENDDTDEADDDDDNYVSTNSYTPGKRRGTLVLHTKNATLMDAGSDDEQQHNALWDQKLEQLVKEIPQDSASSVHQLLEARLTAARFSPRWRNWLIRFLFSCLMGCGVVLIIRLGPMAIIAVTALVHFWCFHEIIAIGHAVYRIRALPWFRTLSWYFLFVSSYFFYGVNIIEAMGTYLRKDNFLASLIKYHNFISYCLYIGGIVLFVFSLRRGYYFRQFSLFAWTHMALLISNVAAYGLVSSCFQGLIWWIMPVLMVVTNDIMAYLFGFFFGRTPLIKVSPKKTWEGFIGGAVSTVLIGLLASYALIKYQYFICPVEFDEQNRAFVMQCEGPTRPPCFRLETYRVGGLTLTCYPFLLHSIVLSTFSSLIGPFGGFFASGFKRACKVKDFGDAIPGHGGLTDRFDCQVLMAIFVHVYIRTFIRPSSPYRIMHQLHAMDVDDQLVVYNNLGRLLMEHGALDNSTCQVPPVPELHS